MQITKWSEGSNVQYLGINVRCTYRCDWSDLIVSDRSSWSPLLPLSIQVLSAYYGDENKLKHEEYEQSHDSQIIAITRRSQKDNNEAKS